MTVVPAALPAASPSEPVRYVVIDDEPSYGNKLGACDGPRITFFPLGLEGLDAVGIRTL
jgi:hypothetical protein